MNLEWESTPHIKKIAPRILQVLYCQPGFKRSATGIIFLSDDLYELIVFPLQSSQLRLSF